MKKLVIKLLSAVVVFVAFAGLTACSDEEGGLSGSKIEGVWKDDNSEPTFLVLKKDAINIYEFWESGGTMYYWSGKNSIYYDASTGIMAQYEGEGEVDFMKVEVVDDALHMRWINYDGEIECSGSGDLKKALESLYAMDFTISTSDSEVYTRSSDSELKKWINQSVRDDD